MKKEYVDKEQRVAGLAHNFPACLIPMPQMLLVKPKLAGEGERAGGIEDFSDDHI